MKVFFIIFISIFFFFQPSHTFAQSDYVLPYPSFMPGSKLYAIEQIQEKLLQYWYFGNYGQFTYNLNQADKYLVEAKTLFEYKQYFLAHRALQKSDEYFKKLPTFIENAEKEKKNTTEKKKLLSDAALKHIEILTQLKNNLPEQFVWRPEKSSPTEFKIGGNIDHAITIRKEAQ